MAIENVINEAHRVVAIAPLPSMGLDRALSVVWTVGRRCNYACSYCSKDFHDRVSPHRSYGELRAIWANIRQAMAPRDLVAAIEFTGGEPTLNPDFLEFVRYLNQSQRPWLRWMGMTSNGTAGLEYYQQICEHLDWICFSTHFEWWDENRFMTMLLDLKRSLAGKGRDTMLSVNLMYEEWNAPHIRKIDNILKAENIRSTPLYIYNIYGSKGITNKSSTPFDYAAYMHERGGTTAPAGHVPEPRTPEPAASVTDALLQHSNRLLDKTNTELTLDDGTTLQVHSQIFSNLHLNNFPGWKCHAGKDRIFIYPNGKIYGGTCLLGELGDVRKPLKLREEPVTCDGRDCFCMTDILVKKWKQDVHEPSGVHGTAPAPEDADATRQASAAD